MSFGEGGGDIERKKAMLDELMAFARDGMAEELRGRYPGKEMTAEHVADKAVDAEDPEIPGVEAGPVSMDGSGDDTIGEGMGRGGEGDAEAAMNPSVLRALLAKMNAKGG